MSIQSQTVITIEYIRHETFYSLFTEQQFVLVMSHGVGVLQIYYLFSCAGG